MATVRIKGGPELKARLASIVASKPEITRAWAKDAASRIAADAPRRTGKLAGSIKDEDRRGKGVVTGAWYGIILDRGTKAYGITPRATGGTLRFTYKGRTIFAKKSNRRRLRRRPFITQGAQEALRASSISDQIIRAWNRKSARGRASRLSL